MLQGDCLDLLNNIPNNSIDLVLTDPPYGIDYQSQRRKDKSTWKPKIKNDKMPFLDWIELIKPKIKSTGGVLCFTRWTVQQVFIDEFTRQDMKPKSIIIWDKLNHSMGDLRRAWGNRYESIIWWANDGFSFPDKRPQDIISIPKVPSSKLIHPNEKPVGLLSILVEKTTCQKATVLDCFMGSGSTGIACINTGRDFIGMELDEHYFKLAKERIEQHKGENDYR